MDLQATLPYMNMNKHIALWYVLLWGVSINSSGNILEVNGTANRVLMKGDIMLGGLFQIHRSSDDETCGSLSPQAHMQALETMVFVVNKINENDTFLPGFDLGVLAYDDCSQEAYSLEQAVHFVDGSNLFTDVTDKTDEIICSNATVEADSLLEEQKNTVYSVAGVVGAASSVNSIQVANLLKLFKIPQISYWSTSPDLSNTDRYPYFFRTVPPDHHQAEVMVELLLHFNWTYITLIHENSNYGIRGVEELHRLARDKGICIAATETLPRDGQRGGEEEYDGIVERLYRRPKARVVILWTGENNIPPLLQAIKKAGDKNKLIFLGSDGWSGRRYSTEHNERILEGAITIQPLADPIRDFDLYMAELQPEDHSVINPWFNEFWENHFNCTLAQQKRYTSNEDDPSRVAMEPCNPDNRLTKDNFKQDGQLQFVATAVLAFAHALHNIHRDFCGNVSGLCQNMKPLHGHTLQGYLRNVTFQDMNGSTFSFDGSGDGPPRYRILNFRQNSRGKYHYEKVGSFDAGNLHIREDLMQFKSDEPEYPKSVCSAECAPGERKINKNGDLCCWVCVPCLKNQFLENETTCTDCEVGFKPTENFTYCEKLETVYLEVDNIAIVTFAFAILGISVTSFIAVVLIRNRATPVVKASSRELCFPLLIGVFICYCSTFLYYVTPPTGLVCGIQLFVMGLGFTLCYSAILVKTNRVHRIFHSGRSTAKRPDFISPVSQLIITGILSGIQAILSFVYMAAFPPGPKAFVVPDENVILVACGSLSGRSLILGMAFPLLLMVMCTIYALLTRKIPSQYSEAKLIGLTMYTTCIIWLAMVPVYAVTAARVRPLISTVNVAICLSCTVCLSCLFVPRVYIILCRPERNVKASNGLRSHSRPAMVMSHSAISNADYFSDTEVAVAKDMTSIS